MELNCLECRQCNGKGKPSVMKGSSYCDSHRIRNKISKRIGLFATIKERLFGKRYDEKTNTTKLKGFRESWFLR